MEMGEYTNDLGIHAEDPICSSIAKSDTITTPFFDALGIQRDSCPPPPTPVSKQLNLIWVLVEETRDKSQFLLF